MGGGDWCALLPPALAALRTVDGGEVRAVAFAGGDRCIISSLRKSLLNFKQARSLPVVLEETAREILPE